MSQGSEESTVVKRTLRRKIQIPNYVDEDVSTNRYQVYRGLSPDTSNRLEMKIKCLEESLEAEKQSKISLENEIQLLLDELQAQTDTNEDLNKKLSDQNSSSRTKEQELVRVKKEYELMLQETEGNEVLMKKKFSEVMDDLSCQLDNLQKQKNRLEGDKRKMVMELSEGCSQLDSANAFKRQLESKVDSLENEVKRLRQESDDKSRQLHELHDVKAKVAHDLTEVTGRLKSLESSSEGATREKSKLLQEIEVLKMSVEEAEAVKPHLLSTIGNLQNDLQLLKNDLEDEGQGKELLQGQVAKLQSELTSQKTLTEKEIMLLTQESESQRKKTLTQLSDADNQLNQQVKKNLKLEKDVTRFNSEIKELYEEIAMHKAQLAEALKRMKAQESLNNEQRSVIDQLQITIDSKIDSEERLQAEVSKLKLVLKSFSDTSDKTARDLKLTTDALREAKDENREVKSQLDNIIIHKNNADKEVLRLTTKVGEGERVVSDKENQIYSLSNELKSLKEDLKSGLRLKEEEIVRLRKAQEKLAEESLRRTDEEQARHKTEVGRVKRVFEAELAELKAAQEATCRQNSELLKNNKSLASKLKESESVVGGLEGMLEEVRGQVVVHERKKTLLESQLEHVQHKLDLSEHSRRTLDLSQQETQQQVEHLSAQLASCQAELKRSEAELLSLKFLTDEFANTKSELEDLIEKQKHELERLNEALTYEMEKVSGEQRLVQELERKVREGKLVLEEVEGRMLKEERKTNAKIAARCQGIEAELEGEQRKVKELSSEVRRLNKQVQEANFEREAEMQEREERDRALESSNLIISKLKKNLMEAEEVIGLVNGKYKRLQQQFNDTTAEQLEAASNHSSHISIRSSNHTSTPKSQRLSISRSLRLGE